jgi:hypothetical protein
MDIHSFYFDQYKVLREEIMFTMGQLYSTEIYGAIAVIAVYAWLSVNSARISVRTVWYIPPLLIFVCAIHCGILSLRLSMIGGYLKEIEEVLGTDTKLIGWEHYKLAHAWVEISDRALATFAWLSAFVGSVIMSWRATRVRLLRAPQPGVGAELGER